MSATELRDVGEFGKALAVDQHRIEPIPEWDRDSAAWQQFRIWFGPISRRFSGRTMIRV